MRSPYVPAGISAAILLVALGSLLAPTGVLVVGFITGLTYALLAMGLVLIFKSDRFINFAHGEIGALSALLLGKFVLDFGWNYWLAFVVAIALAVALGGAMQRGLVRPLSRASRLVVMVATIGVAQLLVAFRFLWTGMKPDPAKLVQEGYPTPVDWAWTIGDHVVQAPQFVILLLVPSLAAVGWFFFRFSDLGLHIRAVASNPDATRLAGISTLRVSTLTWLIAGGISGLTAILLAPSASTYTDEVLGAGLMIRALAPAVIARMTSLPIAFAGGLGLGVLEAVVFSRSGASGVTELVVFAVLVVGLLIRARALARESRAATETLSVRTEPPPLPRVELAEWVPRIGLIVGGAVAVLVPVFVGQSKAFQLTLVVVYALAGLSLTVLVGWSGQLSLGHFAFIGIGAYTAAKMVPNGHTLVLTLLVAAVVGAIIAVLLGLPSLRVRGLFLAVSTLGFAVVCFGWLFNLGTFGAVTVGNPRLPLLGEIESPKGIYYMGLGVFAVLAAGLRALRSSGPGRAFVAVRDNPKAAAAHGLPPAGVRLAAFALSGGIAAMAGVVWGHASRSFDANAFAPQLSLALVATVVLGGAGSLTGAALGAIGVFGVSLIFSLSFSWSLLLSGFGLVGAMLFLRGGIITNLWKIRDVLARELARAVEASRPQRVGDGAPALECRELTVRFGGLTALDAVDLDVGHGEIVGLIGPNGAGKTTLMDCVSGNLSPARGRVLIDGVKATGFPPEYRRSLGVTRSFQSADLYPTMRARDAVQVALESDHRSGIFSAMVKAPWQRQLERTKAQRADEVLGELGLGHVADLPVAELSTGLRRAVELAAVLAQEPRLLLLDEPTAGLSQMEVREFLPLLSRVKERLGCAVLIIEHDMDVIMGLADRIYVLEAGRVISEGSPQQVRADPKVVASYLGRLGDGEATGSGLGSTNGKQSKSKKRSRKRK